MLRPYRCSATWTTGWPETSLSASTARAISRGLDICDAHPELVRAAIDAGEDSEEDCPICEGVKVRLVSYVFGHRLPPSGRCVASKKELAKLARPGKDLACYVVEVCPNCFWNHLAQAFALDGQSHELTERGLTKQG